MSRVTSDIEALAQFFQWGGLAWLLDGTLMLIVAAVMLAYSWQLALIAFAVSMPLAFVLRAVQSRLVRAYDAARHANGDMLGAIAEVVSGTPTIRAYDAGEVLEQRVHEAVEVKTRGADQGVADRRVPLPVGRDLLGVHDLRHRRAWACWMGRRQPDGGCAGRVHLPHVPVPRTDRRVHRGARPDPERRGRAASRVVGARPADRSAAAGRPDRAARRQAAHRHPRGDVLVSEPRSRTVDDSAVLKNIDVTIPAGQQVAIVGSTGSGKTTLGRLIARFADPTIGAIELGGVPLRRVDRAELRRRLVVVSQEPFLFDDSISANVRFAVEHSTTQRRRTGRRRARRARLGRVAVRRPRHQRRRARAISCRRASASSSRCCAPASPARTC